MTEQASQQSSRVVGNGNGSAGSPLDKLRQEAKNLAGAVGQRALAGVSKKVETTTSRLLDFNANGSGSGLLSALTGNGEKEAGNGAKEAGNGPGVLGTLKAGASAAKGVSGLVSGKGGGGGGRGKNLKVTNIVESIDVGVPVRLTYDLWTQFADFPTFMKKVESVEQESEEKLKWRAQILWSHREWESTILAQEPDSRIIWKSEGQKGHVDGAVTFHELAPELTKIMIVLEYYPQGGFEHIGNIWRAQGRRTRLELKNFRRHAMTQAVLHPEEIEGWRGVIQDGEVVQDHESAMREEDEYADDGGEDRAADSYGDADDADDESQYDDEADDVGEAEDEPAASADENGSGRRSRSRARS
jgi:uncharacterized membrane protein